MKELSPYSNKKHTGKYWRIFPYGKSVFKLKLVWRQA